MHWLDIKLDQTQFHATECKLLDNTTTLQISSSHILGNEMLRDAKISTKKRHSGGS